MPRLAFPALLLSSLWLAWGLHAQNENPFDKAAEAREKIREKIRKSTEKAREGPRKGMILPGVTDSDHAFDKAADSRQSARQRAFDRGQKTALPASEERESLGRLPDAAANAIRAEDGTVVKQGAPAAAAYNRVMETRRFFAHYLDPHLYNVNDSFTDKAEDRKQFEAEALKVYPELLRAQSAFAMRHEAINRWIDSRQPPLALDARRKLLVAHMASLELYGNLRRDQLGVGQVPWDQLHGQRPPSFMKRNEFEVEVSGDVVLLPDGIRGKVIRGKDDKPDIIQWLDAEGPHLLSIPQEPSGKVRLFKDYDCDYRRTETLGGNYRIRFIKPKF